MKLDYQHALQIALLVATGVLEYLAAHATDGSLPFHVSAATCLLALSVLGLVSKSVFPPSPAQLVSAASAQLSPAADSVHAQVKPMLDQAVSALEAAK